MTNKLTDLVLYRPFGRHGQNEQAAVITRVWDDGTINLTVFPDYGSPVPFEHVPYSADLSNTPETGAWRLVSDAAKPELAREPTSGAIFNEEPEREPTA